MGKKAILELHVLHVLDFIVKDSNFCQLKTLTGSVLSISESLRSRGQRSRSLDNQIWAKMLFLEPYAILR